MTLPPTFRPLLRVVLACACLVLGGAGVAQAAPGSEGRATAEGADSMESLIRTLPQTAEAAAAADSTPASGDSVLTLLTERGLIDPLRRTGAAVQNAAASVRDRAASMVVSAMNFIGVPYRFGGNDADHGFDCSGFTRYVVEQALGVVLPRRADQQAHADGWQAVEERSLQPGDLVFFNTMRRAFSHVGIYVGDGKFIHAPRRGTQVRVESMRTSYWAQRFDGARRKE